ncbi:protein UL19 [Aotine betaherpesvirus 1]|uniref:Protein UL19 n=1 Tax=Aotine betaherpesvirus 1 TaxID=50290 RepID=G8XU88_9BETA|nr:protein UL19 [Aotine betaherpesvirus 1]AEV80719.1 protein UL19 [Aotine betaherpesvirus 1]
MASRHGAPDEPANAVSDDEDNSLYSFFMRRLPYPPRNMLLYLRLRTQYGPGSWEHLTSISANNERTLFVFGYGRMRIERFSVPQVQCADVLKMKRIRSPNSWIGLDCYPDMFTGRSFNQ